MSKDREKKIIDFLRANQKSCFETIKNRELSAWAIAVLYLTILGVSYSFFIAIPGLIYIYKIIFVFSIWIFMFSVCLFIHTQYSMCINANSISDKCSEVLHNISFNIQPLDKKTWELQKDSSLPTFIIDDVKKKSKRDHHIKNVCPLVIFCVLGNRLWNRIKSRLCKSRIERKNKEVPKINLIEASLTLS